ncbi:MAG: hypothetical protein IKB82_02850 [Clostridia bacterium]|nr:hypothetical protein [Clostridia bacterium]
MNAQIKHKIGQMLSAGFPSPEVDEQARALVSRYAVGNFYLFGRNIINSSQTCDLCEALSALAYEANGVAPFIGIDQEGGAVSRIVDGASLIPGAMALGASPGADVRQCGQNCGEVLTALGVTSPSSPVLDVNLEPLNPIIGARSFGDDPETVARLGTALMQGLTAGGQIATVKHYPGHGNVKSDSHLGVPVNDTDKATLDATEWLPFKRAFALGAEALMTSHVLYSKVDPKWPATLSKTIMTDILRGEQGFTGLVVTDCMEMDAIRKTYGVGEGAVLAVEAGCDLLTFSHTLEAVSQAAEALYAAVESGRITEARIDASYSRIMALKEKHGLLTPPVIDREKARRLADDPAKNALHQQISRNAVTLLQDNGGLAAFGQSNRPAFFAPPSFALTGAEDQKTNPLSFAKVAAAYFGGQSHVMPLNDYCEDMAAAVAGDWDVAVIGLYNARFRDGQIKTLEALKATGKPVIVLLLGAPYDAPLAGECSALIAVHEYTNLSVRSILDALHTCTFTGVMPVRL